MSSKSEQTYPRRPKLSHNSKIVLGATAAAGVASALLITGFNGLVQQDEALITRDRVSALSEIDTEDHSGTIIVPGGTKVLYVPGTPDTHVGGDKQNNILKEVPFGEQWVVTGALSSQQSRDVKCFALTLPGVSEPHSLEERAQATGWVCADQANVIPGFSEKSTLPMHFDENGMPQFAKADGPVGQTAVLDSRQIVRIGK